MFGKLDKKSKDLVLTLYNLKQSLDIYRLIAVNAHQINIAGAGKSFFAYARKLALDSCVVNICKLIEKENKNYELNSIPSVIGFLKKNKLQPKNSKLIKIFIENNKQQYILGEETKAFEFIFQNFRDNNATEFKKLKDFRDKKIAHLENLPEGKETYISSYAVMDRILKFGIDFYSMVQEAYIGTFPVQFDHYTKVLIGLRHLLEIKGIKDIRDDFVD